MTEQNSKKDKPQKPAPPPSIGTQFNFEGGIHAQGDVVLGNQTKYQVANIQTPTEFRTTLQQIQAQVTELKQQPQLTSAQVRNLEVVEARVIEAGEEAAQPKPMGERIRSTLSEAKETLEILAGSLESAVRLGMDVGALIVLASKLFGG